jgi:hypothetical protein
MMTMPASTATLVSVGVTATVRIISAATSTSSPSRMARPMLLTVYFVAVRCAA